MGGKDEPIIPFIERCIKRTVHDEQPYKGFKVKSLLLSTGMQILIMTILFPRKKGDFINNEFEELFKVS